MELIGFCQRNPYDPSTWSGFSRELFLALRNRGVLQAVYDVEVKGAGRYIGALREYSLNRNIWRHNFLKSPAMFERRTRTASEYLDRAGHPDAVLQIGAMFDATALHRDIPRYCYLDSNCALSARGGADSFGYYASDAYKRLAFERERAVYRRSEGIFVFSDYLRQSIIDDFGIAPVKVHTVYAGVNFGIPPIDMNAKRERAILFIGKDFAREGVALLLKAFALVRRALPDTKLIIAGAAPSIDQPNVEVIGFVDKNTPAGEERLAQLFKRAAVFAAPSDSTSFGISYAEAMHFALPCVGLNHYAMPEIVEHHATGLLVPPNDVEALAAALIYILNNPAVAQRMGMEGKKRAEQLFRWDAVAEKLEWIVRHRKEKECFRAVS